jgi:undecaprenyl-diphosphatase
MAAAVVAAVVFVAIGVSVRGTRPPGAVDRAVAAHFFAAAGTTLRTLVAAITLFGSGIPVLGLAAVVAAIAWWRGRDVIAAGWLFAAPFLALVAEIALKYVFARGHPPARAAYREPVNSFFTELLRSRLYSYPSGHVAGTTALVTAIVLLLWPSARGRAAHAGLVAAATAAIVVIAATRLLLGVHYFTDVVGGAALGAVATLVTAGLADRWRGYGSRGRTDRQEGERDGT